MRIAAVACSVALLALTGIDVLTEGMPSRAGDAVLTFVVLLVPLLTAVVLVREHLAVRRHHVDNGGPPTGGLAHHAAVAGNLVVLVACGWAAVARYPYPEGSSVIPYAVLAVVTPILNLAALLAGVTRETRKERGSAAGGDAGRGEPIEG